MNTIRQWICANPFTAISLAALFGATATASGLREDWLPYTGGLFCLGLLVMLLSMWRFTGIILIGFAMALPIKAQERQESAVPIGAAVVVICVGGYCVYRLVKFCQEKFPKEDKGSNSLSGFNATSNDEYGAAWSFNSYGYCYEPAFRPASVEPEATTFNLDVMVGPGGSLQTAMNAVNGLETSQTFAEFQAEVAAHGLFVSDHSQPIPNFERNRIPCDNEYVPLSIDPLSKTITHNTGGIMRHLIVERSMNLVDWSPFLSTQVGEGTGFRVVDTTREGQMFYRVSVQ